MHENQAVQDAQTWQSVENKIGEWRAPHDDELLLENAGDKASVAFIGEPFAFEAVWEEANGWVPFNAASDLHKRVEPALRILINVVVIESMRTAYWEMGVATFKILVDLRENGGLDDCIYGIVRLDDDGAEPGYSIFREQLLSKDLKSHLACLPRLCLATVKRLPTEEKER